MKSKQDILKTKKWNAEYPNYMAESEIEDAMDEFGEEIAIDFVEYLSGNGYRQYDSRDRWINPEDTGNQVFTTKQLFEQYKANKW